jgi:hypothetical protein
MWRDNLDAYSLQLLVSNVLTEETTFRNVCSSYGIATKGRFEHF